MHVRTPNVGYKKCVTDASPFVILVSIRGVIVIIWCYLFEGDLFVINWLFVGCCLCVNLFLCFYHGKFQLCNVNKYSVVALRYDFVTTIM